MKFNFYEGLPFGLFAEGDADSSSTGGDQTSAPAPGTAEAAQAALAESDKKPSLITEKPSEEKPVEKPAEPAAYDPEKLTFPEGFTKDEATLGRFSEIAKANGINLPTAQALMNLYADAVKAESDKNLSTWQTTQDGWVTEVKGDKEIGGANLDIVKQTVAAVLDNPELSDPGLRQALDMTGAGNNPAVIRSLYRWAKALNEGSNVRTGNPNHDPTKGPTPGSKTADEPRTAASVLYPNLPSGVNRG